MRAGIMKERLIMKVGKKASLKAGLKERLKAGLQKRLEDRMIAKTTEGKATIQENR